MIFAVHDGLIKALSGQFLQYLRWFESIMVSGTLRNLKKVEQAIEMLNKLMENDDSEAS